MRALVCCGLADDIAQVLTALGLDEDGVDEDHIFAELDSEGSGVVEWEAFSAWYIDWGVDQAAGHHDDDDELGDLLDDLDDLGGSSTEEVRKLTVKSTPHIQSIFHSVS